MVKFDDDTNGMLACEQSGGASWGGKLAFLSDYLDMMIFPFYVLLYSCSVLTCNFVAILHLVTLYIVKGVNTNAESTKPSISTCPMTPEL